MKRVLKYLAWTLAVTGNLVLAGTCENFEALPSGARLVAARDLDHPETEKFSLMSTLKMDYPDLFIKVIVRDGSKGIVSINVSAPGKFYMPICTKIDVFNVIRVRSGVRFPVDVNVTLTPGARVRAEVYSRGHRARPAEGKPTPGRVRAPVEIFILEGSNMASAAPTHVKAAVSIWEAAGVVLDPKIRKISLASVKELLGPQEKLHTYLGCIQRFNEPGYSERVRLRDLKSSPESIGVFVVDTSTQSQAEFEMKQVYFSNDPFDAPVGRTLAHEIGHLLLGEGHTGGQRSKSPCTLSESGMAFRPKEPAPWTSGLMRDGSKSNATGITDADALVARRAALLVPGATWWD